VEIDHTRIPTDKSPEEIENFISNKINSGKLTQWNIAIIEMQTPIKDLVCRKVRRLHIPPTNCQTTAHAVTIVYPNEMGSIALVFSSIMEGDSAVSGF
jgi:hypothetical protein